MSVRILYLAANPVDTEPLRLGEEARLIEQRLREGKHGSKISFVSHWATRRDDLGEVLLRLKPHIVHFSGHGQSAGIVLQDESGNSQPVDGEALADLLAIVGDRLQCVVLNACYTEQQAEAIAAHVAAVIGTRRAITDDGARRFAAGFYRGISNGKDVESAFKLGTNEVDMLDLPDGATPCLVAKPGTDPSSLDVRGDSWLQERSRRAVAGGGVVAVALAVLLGAALLGGTKTSTRNIELVVDSSSAMAAEYNGTPRLVELNDAVASFTDGATHTALGLSAFGNECADDPARLVPLGVGNGERVSEAVAGIEPSGDADLVSAVRASVDVFADPTIYPSNVDREHVATKVVVITSSSDGCGGDLAALQKEAEGIGVQLDFQVIGFRVDDETQDELRTLAQSVNGESLFADTGDELDQILDDINIDAFRDDTNILTDLINQVSAPINDAFSAYIDAVNAQLAGEPFEDDVAAARTAAAEARNELEVTAAQYEAMEKPDAPDAYREMWQLDGTLRTIQEDQTAVVEQLIDLIESGQSPIEEDSDAARLDETFRTLSQELREGNRVFRELQDEFLESLTST